MLSTNTSREFKNSGLPTPSIDTSRLPDLSRDPTSMSESFLRVIVLPSYFILYLELDIKQDEIIRKVLLIKHEAERVC